MIPVSLSLKNFLCYRGEVPTLHLESVHVACLSGANGHGKSALLDAITWALWGEARGRRHDDLIYHGEREMRVTLEFEARDTHYQVVRRHSQGTTRRQGHSSLELLVSSGNGLRPITSNTMVETQSNIIRLLNMDFHTFVNSAFLVQGRADEFTRATPSQRKEVLAGVLGLGLYDRLEARARATARELQTEARSLELEVERLSQEVDASAGYQQELSQAQQELSRVESMTEAMAREVDAARRSAEEARSHHGELEAIQIRILDYTNQLSALEEQTRKRRTRLQEYQEGIGRVPQLKDNLDRVRTDLEAIELEDGVLTHTRERLQANAVELHRLRSDNVRLKEQMGDLRVKVDILQRGSETPTCPLCKSPLEAEGCSHLAETYRTQGTEKATAYRDNEDAIHRLDEETAGLKAEISQLEESNRLRRKQGEAHLLALEKELQTATISQGLITNETEALETEVNLIQSRKWELKQAMERKAALEGDLQSLPAVEGLLRQREQTHRELLGSRDSLRERQSVLKDRIKRCEELERILKQNDERMKTTQQEVSIYRELADAFGKGGIQALMIEASKDRLEDEANRLLARMTDHRMTIKLETQRVRRTKPDAEPVETLDILVADELGTRDYQMFSGGEAFRINFALRIALSKLLAERAGAPLPTLFIDEGFGTQDAAGRDRILDIIRAIQDDFKRIIVITHMEEVKEAFPVRIEVTKSDSGSTFTIG